MIKKVHVTFQKIIPESLNNANANIEVTNLNTGKVTNFNNVMIGENGAIKDSKVYSFDGSLEAGFLLTENQTGVKSSIPDLGEKETQLMIFGGIILISGLGFMLIIRRKKAGKWFLVFLIAGGILGNGTAQAQSKETTNAYDFTQQNNFKEGTYTIKVILEANEDENEIQNSNQGILKVHDSTIYVGESWATTDNVTLFTDKDGIALDPSLLIVSGAPNSAVPGTYTVTLSYPTLNLSKNVNVVVLENKTSLVVKDITIERGTSWNPVDNFVSATDKTGASLSVNQVVTDTEPDTNTLGVYPITYTNGEKSEVAQVTVQAPKVPGPVDNGNGTVDFMGLKWDIIRRDDKGNLMIAMQTSLGDSKFATGIPFYNTDDSNSDGYSDSLVKGIVDQWYQNNVADTGYEQFVNPVSLPNPTLGDMIGYEMLIDHLTDGKEVNNNSPLTHEAKYQTVVDPKGNKQAFLMSAADVSTGERGAYGTELTAEALAHRDRLSANGVFFTWLRSPGLGYKYVASIYASTHLINSFYTYSENGVVPTLSVHL